MKITEKIEEWQKTHKKGKPFFSLEFFPPKTDTGLLNLYERFDRFAPLNPLWFDVTWGAGGSTATTTLDICANGLRYHGMEPLMHLTCTNMSQELLKTTLEKCKARGIRNILALRGDPPTSQDSWQTCNDGFCHAIDLVKYIRREHGDYFCIGVAGYPEGHLENPSKEDDLRRLKEKVDAGADLIITQLFFDVNEFASFVTSCRELGITVPILPGILPIQSYAGFVKMTSFCKTKVPDEIKRRLNAIKDDDQKVKDYGVELCVEICRHLVDSDLTPGLHFYTLNLEVSVLRILDGLHLIDIHLPNRDLPWRPRLVRCGSGSHKNALSMDLTSSASARRFKSPSSERNSIQEGLVHPAEEVRPIFWSNRPKSYIQRTEDWDDFPNGRWGNRDSPAYGEPFYSMCQDPSDRSAQVRREMWGAELHSFDDVIRVFVNYLKHGQPTKRLPWTSEKLGDETLVVKKQLLKLNTLGLCTINSQPRVNGALSTDPIFGWGPTGGVVYQKAYLEFFCSEDTLKVILNFLEQPRAGEFTYMCVNQKGELKTNCSTANANINVNAVTWGVFPNAEIRQPTVVDLESFIVWKDEAFALWLVEWRDIYPPDSKSREIIQSIHDTWYLVNIVDNNFLSGDLFGLLIAAISEEIRPVDLSALSGRNSEKGSQQPATCLANGLAAASDNTARQEATIVAQS